MKRFFAILTILCMLFTALAGFALAEADPADNPEEKSFEADGYTIRYEVVTADRVEEVVGSLAQYIKTDDVDMEKNRLFYIHYLSVEKDGTEMAIGSALMFLSVGRFVFTVDGVEYTQPALLMSTGTQTFLTYLFVPAETPDDAEVSIECR